MSDGRGSTKVEFTAFTNERGEQSERGWHHRRSSGEVEGEKRRKSKSKKSSRDRVDRTAVNTSTTTNHNVSVDVGVGAQMQGQTLPQPPQQPLQQLPQHHTYLSGSQGDGGVAMQFPGAYPPPQNMIPRGEMVQVQHPPPQATIATNNTVILQQQQPQPQIMAAAEGTSNEYIPRATENFHSRDKTRVWGAFIAIGRRSRSSSPAKEKRWKKKEKEWITREVFGSGGHGEGCEECRDGGQN
ncbi:hypothetical protein DFH27DRAFT_580272 [Peziza echinospora]|nr:hypothetical protein DFH27DRAFT_580272 [Peziza echinospora]